MLDGIDFLEGWLFGRLTIDDTTVQISSDNNVQIQNPSTAKLAVVTGSICSSKGTSSNLNCWEGLGAPFSSTRG
jgi:hypothetical protein